MPDTPPFHPRHRHAAVALALLAGAILALQYLLILRATRDTLGPVLGTVQFLSFFTILSNLGVLLVSVSAARGAPVLFAHAAARGAVAVYIGITGLVYLAVLRHTWDPQGAWWLADVGLHYVVPALYLAGWLAWPGHGALRWWHAVAWLAFPVAYLAWVLVRGAWLGEYPYPFVDVRALGWSRLAANVAVLLGVFLAFGLAVVGVDGVLARRRALARAQG